MTARMAADAIEGGRAAIIRPEVRRRLVAAAVGMGLRPFDANLVIAIVQDDARSAGEAARIVASGATRDATSRLTLVRPAQPANKRSFPVRLVLAAIVAGIAASIAFASWIMSG